MKKKNLRTVSILSLNSTNLEKKLFQRKKGIKRQWPCIKVTLSQHKTKADFQPTGLFCSYVFTTTQ